MTSLMSFTSLPKDIVTKIYIMLNLESRSALLASSKNMCTRIDWHRFYYDHYSDCAKERNRIESEKIKIRISQMLKEKRIQLGIDHLFH